MHSENLVSFGSANDLVFVNGSLQKRKLLLSFVTAKKDTLEKGSPYIMLSSVYQQWKR